MELEKLRNDIDKIDRRVLTLLCQRFEIVEKIARLKTENGTPVEDPKREIKIINVCKEENEGRLNHVFIEKILHLIISESKRIQEKTK